MPKNTHIHIKVSSEHIKEILQEKAEAYGSLSNFFEHIAQHDIIVLDKNAAKLLRTWMREEEKEK
jgi:translation initiation factor 2 alpha subunit (eIF-2alpha)